MISSVIQGYHPSLLSLAVLLFVQLTVSPTKTLLLFDTFFLHFPPKMVQGNCFVPNVWLCLFSGLVLKICLGCKTQDQNEDQLFLSSSQQIFIKFQGALRYTTDTQREEMSPLLLRNLSKASVSSPEKMKVTIVTPILHSCWRQLNEIIHIQFLQSAQYLVNTQYKLVVT